jgi:hypothetical protein
MLIQELKDIVMMVISFSPKMELFLCEKLCDDIILIMKTKQKL